MTTRDCLLGFGNEWTIITPGDVIDFLVVNFAIFLFHNGGLKEDLWMSDATGNYLQSLFMPANLGQYRISYSYFKKSMRAFEVPSNGEASDPFELIGEFTDTLNENMIHQLVPRSYITVDESTRLWRGKGMPGGLFVKRKPPSVGRESHTTADYDTGTIIFC